MPRFCRAYDSVHLYADDTQLLTGTFPQKANLLELSGESLKTFLRYMNGQIGMVLF